MTRDIHRLVLSNAVLAAGLLVSAGHAQAPRAQSPQNGIWQTGGVIPSHSGSANSAPATAASPTHQNTEASKWSAGRGDFGAQNTMPLATRGVSKKMGRAVAPSSGSSGWTAGQGSFGQAAQPDGIWRDSTGLRSPGRAASTSSSPNFMSVPPAFTLRPMGKRSPQAALRRPLPGAHQNRREEPGILSQASKHSQGSTLRRPETMATPRGSRNRISPQSGLRTSLGAGLQPTPPSSKMQTPEQ
jgi:hypothetical protein